MFLLHNGKTWAEMTTEERKMSFIVIGIMAVVLIVCGIYEYFKKKKNK